MSQSSERKNSNFFGGSLIGIYRNICTSVSEFFKERIHFLPEIACCTPHTICSLLNIYIFISLSLSFLLLFGNCQNL